MSCRCPAPGPARTTSWTASSPRPSGDYLAAGLDLDAKNRLLSQLNNHFGLYVYGKQIVDGVKPFWDGVGPYQIGNIPEWTAARQQAVDEAVAKIIER
ncbi:MAG TPA: hypothetical protein VGG54_10530, partial [Trebonia sp.]